MAVPTRRDPRSPYYFASGYQPTRRPKQPRPPAGTAGTGMGPGYWDTPYYEDDLDNPRSKDPGDAYWNSGDWGNGVIGIGAGPAGGYAAPGGPTNPTRSITLAGKDYKGILDRWSADARARINTGLANMNVARLGSARSAINKLGIRDPAKALAKFAKYGLTAADLQAAADNPWSDIKAIAQNATRDSAMGAAQAAARGTYNSGGTAALMADIENQKARAEALADQQAEMELAGGQNAMLQWQNDQENAFRSHLADLQMQFETNPAYQEQTAEWDETEGGYRHGNIIYDAQGNIIRRL